MQCAPVVNVCWSAGFPMNNLVYSTDTVKGLQECSSTSSRTTSNSEILGKNNDNNHVDLGYGVQNNMWGNNECQFHQCMDISPNWHMVNGAFQQGAFQQGNGGGFQQSSFQQAGGSFQQGNGGGLQQSSFQQAGGSFQQGNGGGFRGGFQQGLIQQAGGGIQQGNGGGFQQGLIQTASGGIQQGNGGGFQQGNSGGFQQSLIQQGNGGGFHQGGTQQNSGGIQQGNGGAFQQGNGGAFQQAGGGLQQGDLLLVCGSDGLQQAGGAFQQCGIQQGDLEQAGGGLHRAMQIVHLEYHLVPTGHCMVQQHGILSTDPCADVISNAYSGHHAGHDILPSMEIKKKHSQESLSHETDELERQDIDSVSDVAIQKLLDAQREHIHDLEQQLVAEFAGVTAC